MVQTSQNSFVGWNNLFWSTNYLTTYKIKEPFKNEIILDIYIYIVYMAIKLMQWLKTLPINII